MFGLFGLDVIVKGIISLFLIVFVALKTSRGISLAFNMLAFISNLGFAFVLVMFFFPILKALFFYISILNNGIYSSSKRERCSC